MNKKVVFPSSIQCGHAAASGFLEFCITSVVMSPKTLLRAELTQRVALGEKFTVGYLDARSECRSKRWISPRGQVVSRAIVSAHYSIQTALLTNNRSEVVVTNEVRFKRRKRPTKTDSVSQAVFLETAGEYEAFQDILASTYCAPRMSPPQTVKWQEPSGHQMQPIYMSRRLGYHGK